MESEHTQRKAIATKFVVAGRVPTRGTSDLYKATHADTGRLVAVREFAPATGSVPEALSQFSRLAALHSRFLADLIDAGDLGDGRVYVAHGWVDGESLAERLARKGKVPPAEAAALASRVLRGLSALHQRGLVHGSLRPTRVFNERVASGGWHVKVLSTGVHSLSRDEVARDASLARYAPPEWVAGAEPAPAGDVYGVALLLFELVAGQPAFPGDDAAHVAAAMRAGAPAGTAALAKAPKELVAFLGDCLAADPGARPEHAGQMLERLLALYPDREREGEKKDWTRGGVVAKPAADPLALPKVESRTLVERERRRTSARTAAVGAALLTGVAALAIGGVLYARSMRRERELLQRLASAPAPAPTSAAAGGAPSAAGGANTATTANAANAASASTASNANAASATTPGNTAAAPNGATTSATDAGPSSAPSAAGSSSASANTTATSATTATTPESGTGTARPARDTNAAASVGARVRAPEAPPAATPATTASDRGALEFRTSNPCSLVLDGRVFGSLSMTRLDLAPGAHRLTCHSSRGTQQLVVRVYAGRLTRVRVGSTGEAEVETLDAPAPTP